MIRELDAEETQLAYMAMKLLRPTVGSESEFTRQVNDVQRPEGYRLVGLFNNGLQHAVCVAGFRISHTLAWKRFLYVDDLSTLEEYRCQGYAGKLLDWLKEEAIGSNCDSLHLDSGTFRLDAHSLYFKKDMRITAFHFNTDSLPNSPDCAGTPADKLIRSQL